MARAGRVSPTAAFSFGSRPEAMTAKRLSRVEATLGTGATHQRASTTTRVRLRSIAPTAAIRQGETDERRLRVFCQETVPPLQSHGETISSCRYLASANPLCHCCKKSGDGPIDLRLSETHLQNHARSSRTQQSRLVSLPQSLWANRCC